jgi:hypothetical protein
MNKIFLSPIAGELHSFLQFKRSLGYGYRRAESSLREFDKFLSGYAGKDPKCNLNAPSSLGCRVSPFASQ